MTDEQKPLTPDARAKKGAAGVETKLGDGNNWLLALAPTARGMDPLRDALYDEMILRESVRLTGVRAAAWTLLLANYDLTHAEAGALVSGAETEGLVNAVVECLLGSEEGKARTYSKWIRSSLLANGLDPAKIPADLVHDVIELLIKTGRTVPAEKYVEAAVYQEKRAAVLAQAEW